MTTKQIIRAKASIELEDHAPWDEAIERLNKQLRPAIEALPRTPNFEGAVKASSVEYAKGAHGQSPVGISIEIIVESDSWKNVRLIAGQALHHALDSIGMKLVEPYSAEADAARLEKNAYEDQGSNLVPA